MKVHCINILLFALPLTILENTHKKNPTIITRHTQTNRSLCECDLYMPNYDNDPQMKTVMDNFNKQTQQRFQEYDERMKTTRQKCKDRCDKESQKIILKDKLEKELMDKFATLHTDIQSDTIPTCICEKSIADKVEQFCLNCGMNVGGGVTLSSGVLGGIGQVALSAWKPKALDAAIKAALKANDAKILAAGFKAGNTRGMEIVTFGLEHFGVDELFPGVYNPFVNTGPYTEVTNLASSILEKYGPTCTSLNRGFTAPTACSKFQVNLGIYLTKDNPYGTPESIAIPQRFGELLKRADVASDAAAKIAREGATNAIKAQEIALIEGGFDSTISSINAAIIAIVIIVLIMVIIYLILRYRRKKKMKKKLQYIKLLEE
ncbi:rifin [Plasmodium reichenowi]|uniref:Rifin n=1 Tax=Plasmodium reichenowi TaxID=5854 RepID=A0A060RPU3_PLARE|nr:rifin [Plasmodium reichenowi]